MTVYPHPPNPETVGHDDRAAPDAAAAAEAPDAPDAPDAADAPDAPSGSDAGMSTAEYAIGTVAACGFAGVLWAVVHSDAVARLLQGVLERALSLAT